jgi:hypothetical protein
MLKYTENDLKSVANSHGMHEFYFVLSPRLEKLVHIVLRMEAC